MRSLWRKNWAIGLRGERLEQGAMQGFVAAKLKLTHLNEQGAADMVDVGGKSVSERSARAAGAVTMKPETLQLVREGEYQERRCP